MAPMRWPCRPTGRPNGAASRQRPRRMPPVRRARIMLVATNPGLGRWHVYRQRRPWRLGPRSSASGRSTAPAIPSPAQGGATARNAAMSRRRIRGPCPRADRPRRFCAMTPLRPSPHHRSTLFDQRGPHPRRCRRRRAAFDRGACRIPTYPPSPRSCRGRRWNALRCVASRHRSRRSSSASGGSRCGCRATTPRRGRRANRRAHP